MSTFLSPEVRVKETDLTTSTAGVSTSTGGFVGEFSWGPVNAVVQVSNEAVLVSRFGKPSATTFASFYSAKNFLDYSNNLMLVRASTAGQLNSIATGTPIKISNLNDYQLNYSTGQGTIGMFAAKYPGKIGDSLKISMADKTTYSTTMSGTLSVTIGSNVISGSNTAFDVELTVGSYIQLTVSGSTTLKKVTAISSAGSVTVDSTYTATAAGLTGVAKWEYYDQFTAAPVDSERALQMGASNDGLHVIIIDEDGLFSGTPGTILESYDNLSKSFDASRFDGSSAYYKNALNNSQYIWWMDHPLPEEVTGSGSEFGDVILASATFKTLKKPVTRSLSGGADGAAATSGELQLAYDVFKQTEQLDVSLLFTGAANTDVQRYVIQNIAAVRKDCVAFVSPYKISTSGPIIGDTSASMDEMITWYNTINLSSSYGIADSGYKYQYDKYNDVYRWVPLNADIAGLCARTDDTSESWFSPAGLVRGQIKNVTRLGYNPDKAARDELFKRNINPVVAFPGEGTVLFGDKTMMRRPSAFDNISVRRLFILLEKTIANVSKYYLFEQNNELTRQLFSATINPILRDIKGRQGINDFYIDVSEQVNTPSSIDAGELRANIFIKPIRSIRFISLNFVATKSSADFTELELQLGSGNNTVGNTTTF